MLLRRPCRGCKGEQVTISRAEFKRLSLDAHRGREAQAQAADLRQEIRRLTALLDGRGLDEGKSA